MAESGGEVKKSFGLKLERAAFDKKMEEFEKIKVEMKAEGVAADATAGARKKKAEGVAADATAGARKKKADGVAADAAAGAMKNKAEGVAAATAGAKKNEADGVAAAAAGARKKDVEKAIEKKTVEGAAAAAAGARNSDGKKTAGDSEEDYENVNNAKEMGDNKCVDNEEQESDENIGNDNDDDQEIKDVEKKKENLGKKLENRVEDVEGNENLDKDMWDDENDEDDKGDVEKSDKKGKIKERDIENSVGNGDQKEKGNNEERERKDKDDEPETKFDDEKADLTERTTEDAVEKFVGSKAIPLVVDFKHETAQKIFSEKVESHLLLLLFTTAEGYADQIEMIQGIAKEHKGQMLFVTINSNEYDHKSVLEFLSMKRDELPSFRAIRLAEDMIKYKFDNAGIEGDNIRAFIKEFIGLNPKQLVMSEEIPEDWDKLGEKHKHNKSIVIAKIDSTDKPKKDLCLREVIIENENYVQVVEDFNSCLEKSKDELHKYHTVEGKPKEGIGIVGKGAIVHTLSSVKFNEINVDLTHYVSQFNLGDKDMLSGVKTDIKYVQVFVVINARANMNVSSINHQQLVEYVGTHEVSTMEVLREVAMTKQFKFNMESYSLNDAEREFKDKLVSSVCKSDSSAGILSYYGTVCLQTNEEAPLNPTMGRVEDILAAINGDWSGSGLDLNSAAGQRRASAQLVYASLDDSSQGMHGRGAWMSRTRKS